MAKSRPPLTVEPQSQSELLGLSPRQTQVLEAVSRGLLDKQIADELHTSLGTVRAHLVLIFARLGVENRVQAAVLYVRATLAGTPRQE